jgi:hypothetical protein
MAHDMVLSERGRPAGGVSALDLEMDVTELPYDIEPGARVGDNARSTGAGFDARFRRPLLSPWSPRGMSNVQNGEGLPGGRIKNLERISNQGDHPHRRTLGQTLAALRHHRDPRDRCANVGLERGRYRAAEALRL